MTTQRVTVERADFRHLRHLTDHNGLFEHALGTTPRPDHGYCTDDNARLLVVCSREQGDTTADLLAVSLDFVVASVDASGKVRNRMDINGRWTDQPTTDDCWGRAIWGLGTAASTNSSTNTAANTKRVAHAAFDVAVEQRSRWSRAMAFAAIGAAEALPALDQPRGAKQLLADAINVIGLVPTIRSAAWTWTEPTLRYSNAALPEALIAAGHALGRNDALDSGLAMLDWLMRLQSSEGHLSLVGAQGRTRADNPHARQFDQQSIEAAALADACYRAWNVTGDRKWADGVRLAHDWFAGKNDAGLPMWDPSTGGGYDGLHVERVNINQGAESTLAYVSTVQRFLMVCEATR